VPRGPQKREARSTGLFYICYIANPGTARRQSRIREDEKSTGKNINSIGLCRKRNDQQTTEASLAVTSDDTRPRNEVVSHPTAYKPMLRAQHFQLRPPVNTKATADQWSSFRKTATIGTLASQAKIGCLGQSTGGGGALQQGSRVYHRLKKKFETEYTKSCYLANFGRKMVHNAVHNASLYT